MENAIAPVARIEDPMSGEYLAHYARAAEKQAYRDKREQARKHQHDRDEE